MKQQPRSKRRGAGIAAIAIFIAGWGLIRMATWESPLLQPDIAVEDIFIVNGLPAGRPRAVRVADASAAYQIGPVGFASSAIPAPRKAAPVIAPAADTGPLGPEHVQAATGTAQPRMSSHLPIPPLRADYFAGLAPRGHERSADVAMAVPVAARPVMAEAHRGQTVSPEPRWSGDAWTLWRRGSDAPLIAGQPSYGRSQAGAVLRAHLTERRHAALQGYVRVTSALEGVPERELALGLSTRPVPDLPLRLMVDGRASKRPSGTELRGAAFIVTEFPPLELPLGTRGEIYVQAGYVTGDAATPFVDGQARVSRPFLRAETAQVEGAISAWGGAQQDAGRLDIGPSVAVNVRLGRAYGRISAAYRLRIAGDAAPASGPALTVTAGF